MTHMASGQPATPADANHFAHEVFVVHADAARDRAFVDGYLLGNLGLAPERVFRFQDLELGQPIISEIERGVRSSRIMLVVLSTAYMSDRWAPFVQQLAAFCSVDSGYSVLVPLLLEDCEITTHLASLVKLDFRDAAREAWDRELARLRELLRQPALPVSHLTCPYPGMRPFTKNDDGLFFGRDSELNEILYRLRHGERELYLIGPSGSGKSSLLAAGLLPRLAACEDLPRFVHYTIRPGEYPLEILAAVLDGNITAPAVAIHQLLARSAPATHVLLVIDQLEELFTTSRDDQRRGFFALVKALRADSRCVLVFALRGDFYYGAFMDSPLWADNQGRISRIDIGPLSRTGLQQAIVDPARQRGIHLEPELVSRLLDDAEHEPGALPFLQETLQQLWKYRQGLLLSLAAYQALGNGGRPGLAFAIELHADFVLDTLTPRQQTIAFRILLRLVSFGEGRADTRRQQSSDALRSADDLASDFDAVLHCLVDQRLVTVTGNGQRGEMRVDLAHEFLIHAWGAFAERIRTLRAPEQRRRDLEAAAAAWRASGAGDDGLLGANRLAAAVEWRDRAADELGQTVDLAAFLVASEAALEKARRRESEQREERNRVLMESSQLYQELGHQRLFEAQRPLEAIPYLVASRQAAEASGGPPGPSLCMMFAEATRNLPISPPLRHPSRVTRAVFSDDGAHVVTIDDDGATRVWDAATGLPTAPRLEHSHRVVDGAFSPDGKRVVTIQERTARVCDAATGEPISPALEHQDRVWSATFSPDGTRVVTASADGTALIWDAVQGNLLSPALRHDKAVTSAAFSPDGSRVVTASWDHTARIWDAKTGEPMSWPLQHHGRTNSAAFSPDGTCIVTASEDRTARIWDAGRPRSVALPHRDFVKSAAFSADGARIVTASEDGTAQVWDAATAAPLSPPLQHRDRVTAAVFSADGARVVTASDDGTARIWDAITARAISPALQHSDRVTSAAFSRDGMRVVTASRDGTARIWNAATAELLSPPLPHDDHVNSAAFNSDGTRIVTASSDKCARIWNVTICQLLSLSLPHQDSVVSAAFSSDGTRIVTASWDGTARVWDAVTGTPLSPPLQHQDRVVSAVFRSDGSRVVTASEDRTARIWDAATGKPLSPPLEHSASVASATFSPDGTRIVTTSSNRVARIWDIASGKPLSPPLRHRGSVNSAVFSPEGARVLTTGDDSAARLWDLPLSSGTLADWRDMMDRAGMYVLAHGVLSPRVG